MSPGIAAVDESAATGGEGLSQFIDEKGLTEELVRKNPNRQGKHPFRVYCEQVRERAGVPDAQEVRKMCSIICAEIARLPFIDEEEVEAQIKKTAERAEAKIESAMVWTTAAKKLAKVAIELRIKDPDGSKQIAWVNDPLPGEKAA